MIEVTIPVVELKAIGNIDVRNMYVMTKLRQAGVPISSFLDATNTNRGILSKEKVNDDYIKFIWSE